MAYFFHLSEGHETILDQVGTELPDLDAAHELALKTIGALVSEAVAAGDPSYEGVLDVEDEHGRRLLTFSFACPVTIKGAALQQAGGR